MLAEVYFGIVAYIEALAEAAHVGIVTYNRRIKYHLFQFGIGTDDRILNDRRIYSGELANGDIGANDGIADIATFGNVYRLYNNRSIEGGILRVLIIHLLEEDGIGR